jgi:hypothetical protein
MKVAALVVVLVKVVVPVVVVKAHLSGLNHFLSLSGPGMK